MAKSIEAQSFELMAECSTDVLCRLTTVDMLCTYCSPSAVRVLGWHPDDLLHHLFKGLIHPDDISNARKMHDCNLNGESHPIPSSTLRVRKKDGSYAWLEVNSCLMRDPETKAPWQVLLNMRDISDRIVMEEQLEALSLTDALTGLGNRRAFDQALESEWRRARRDHAAVSLLMLDLDDFKGVNDEYGHQAGDECLRRIAATIRAVARRPGDVAARYGGEELALILPATEAGGAGLVAEQVRRAIEGLHFPHRRNHEHGGIVTVSVGVATAMMGLESNAVTPDRLIKAADSALYLAKTLGRNRVETTAPVLTMEID